MNALTQISSKTHRCQYCFTYPLYIKHSPYEGYALFKVGDTKQGLDLDEDEELLDHGYSSESCARIRIDQQGTSAEAFAKILVHSFIHTRIPGKFERDYQLHEMILNSGGFRTADLDGKGREWFYLPYNKDDEVPFQTTINFLNDCVEKLIGHRPRRYLKLKKIQEEKIQEFLKVFEEFLNGEIDQPTLFTVIGILFARFGKTIWTLELFRRLNENYGFKVLILPAYVLSSHSSFEKEIYSFEEFRNLEFINAYDFKNNMQMQKKLDKVFEAKKLPVISVSMHANNLEIFRPLRNLEIGDIFAVVDEADRGAWKDKSRQVINFIFKTDN